LHFSNIPLRWRRCWSKSVEYTVCNKSFWNFLFTHFSTTTAQNL